MALTTGYVGTMVKTILFLAIVYAPVKLGKRQKSSVAFVMSSSFKDWDLSNGTWLFFLNFCEACFLGETRHHK